MFSANPYFAIERIAAFFVALSLGILGASVLISWHSPQLLEGIYPYATLMAYTTAIAFCACGLGLYGVAAQKPPITWFACVIIFAISILSLLDLFTGLPIDVTSWFMIFFTGMPDHHSTPPTASVAFLIAGAALLFGSKHSGIATVATCLLCIVILFITLTAMLGQGYGILPRFVWLGINMAPHTALGFILFAGALMGLRAFAAVDAFNRFTLFNRLATGLVMISLLFVGVGSIGSLQINNVASITQDLYENPTQVNNAALRIKGSVGRINRHLKDIAVNPELLYTYNIPESMREIQFEITRDLNIIAKKTAPANITDLDNLFKQWRQLILENYNQLVAGNIEVYRRTTLNDIQESTIRMEYLSDEVAAQAQARMLQLNDDVLNAKKQAANLMLFVMVGFLLTAIIVAAVITRSLTWQLQKIRDTMEHLARGETDVKIPFLDHPHEMGVMAKTLAVFAENIEARKQNALLLVKHQAELESTNHRLAQTNKELETFAYVASHDLKSPLRGIAQLSTWIEEDLNAKEFSEIEKHTSMLRNRIHRMERLLDDMLIFYRAGKTDGKIKTVDVKHMAADLFEIQNTKAGLNLELGQELPTFETLSTPFEQVMRNLFSNAIKHHDREHGVIRLEAKDKDDFYEFSVCDDGPGIPEKFQERVFGMFQTLKPRDELEGSGMGLALIKKLVETYGGNIKVFSEGRGCCFIFTWPKFIEEKITI